MSVFSVKLQLFLMKIWVFSVNNDIFQWKIEYFHCKKWVFSIKTMSFKYRLRKCCTWDIANWVKSDSDVLITARSWVRNPDLVFFMICWLRAVVGLAQRTRRAGGCGAHNAVTFTDFSMKQSKCEWKILIPEYFQWKKVMAQYFQ